MLCPTGLIVGLQNLLYAPTHAALQHQDQHAAVSSTIFLWQNIIDVKLCHESFSSIKVKS